MFATGIKELDWWKSSLMASSFPSKTLDGLIVQGSKDKKRSHASLVSVKMCWSVDISRSEFILIPWSTPKKNIDRLIPFDPDHKRFYSYMRPIYDYPLLLDLCTGICNGTVEIHSSSTFPFDLSRSSHFHSVMVRSKQSGRFQGIQSLCKAMEGACIW